MSAIQTLNELLAVVLRESSTSAALTAVLNSAIRATESRNGVMAILDDESGTLEILYGCGPDWSLDRVGHEMDVGIERSGGITALVAATKETFVTGDVSEVSAYQKLFDSTQSEIAVPIFDRYGLIRAVLNVESERGHAYTKNEVRLVEAIGAIASLVLERDESSAREEALVEVGTALDDAVTEEEILEKVIDVASQVLRFQACSIFLLDSRSQRFVLRAATGALKDKVGEVTYEPSEGITGWVCALGEAILLQHPQQDPRWRGKFTEIPSDEIDSFLAVPIVIRGKSSGAIRVLRQKAENEYLNNQFTETDLRLMQAIADQLAVGLESIRSMNKLLHSERMTAWGELSAKSSHMIGNRVFALKGDLNELEYQLRSDTPDIQELRTLERGMNTNVIRLQQLLQEFRDFVTATQVDIVKGDLNQLIREVVEEVFPKRSQVELEMNLGEDLPPADFDPRKLRSALSELVENSLSFMESGKLSVSTRPAEPELVRSIRGNTTRKFVAVTIEDSGPGVPSEIHDLIFQPFFTSRVKGMGLGLSIVKGIIDAHGGTVVERGAPGKGAKFVILLPV